MHIVHVVDDPSQANTGITSAVRELARAAIAAGSTVEVVSAGPTADWGVRGLVSRCAPVRGVGPLAGWRYAPGFGELLRRAAGTDAVIHIHGLWLYPQWQAARIALAAGWRVVLSPHNMLGGWLWRRGRMRRIKKSLYFNAFLKGPLSSARAIHALSDDERSRIAPYFSRSRIVTIPNALDLPALDDEMGASRATVSISDRYVLFLGRKHPVKGLDALIAAMAQVPGLRLILAGPAEDGGYERSLRAQAKAAGLEDRVAFAGAIYGVSKWKLMAGAWVFCSPSHSEGMSMASVEAMAAGVPVVTTPGAGFSEMTAAGGALVQPNPAEIAAALTDASRWTVEERTNRGVRARSAVEQNYSWPKVWPLYEQLYRSAAG